MAEPQADEIEQLSLRYSATEELVHTLTHGVGALAAIAGVALLTALTLGQDVRVLASCGAYGATLVLMFAASTAYHAVPFSLRGAKRALQRLDHCAIFLLIAGTYTPFTLLVLGGIWGYALFAAVWLLAVFGIARKVLPSRSASSSPLVLYLGMGWLVVFALPMLIKALPSAGLVLVVGGGLSYTLGTAFYVWHRLPYHHAIWHGFVLLGSLLHFFAVLLYVVPAAR